jgi:alkylation response protein AidB-like acyl-CoA dehydrogenase
MRDSLLGTSRSPQLAEIRDRVDQHDGDVVVPVDDVRRERRAGRIRGSSIRAERLYQSMWANRIVGKPYLRNLELSHEYLLRESGQGFEIAMTTINWAPIRRGGVCAGWAAYLIHHTLERAMFQNSLARHSRRKGQWMSADMHLDWAQGRALSRACDRQGSIIPVPGGRVSHARTLAVSHSQCSAATRRSTASLTGQVPGLGGSEMTKDRDANKVFLSANVRLPT